MNDELRLLLACLSAAGPRRRSLGARLRDANLQEVAKLPELAPRPRDWDIADRQRLAMHKLGMRALMGDQIPPALHAQGVAALFVRGPLASLHRPALGVVGSRRATPEGRAWARALAQEAARAGWVVVSGGAVGIDRAAHEGALQVRGPTVAYLGVAVDRVYPRANVRFFGEMLRAGGTLVSEHPPGAPTAAYDHARRNRLIAAHAEAVWIAEAAAASGSLGTAQWARRLGKGVWVSPVAHGPGAEGLRQLVDGGHATPWLPGQALPPPWDAQILRPRAG